MSKRLLIVGMNAFDSGKTFIAGQLAEYLNSLGMQVEYFKPVSGHNYWYKYEHSKRCRDDGELISSDAVNVRGKFTTEIPIEIANPIHRLYSPVKDGTLNHILLNTLALGGKDSVFTVERLTSVENGKMKNTYLVAESILNENGLLVDKEFVEEFISDNIRVEVNSLEEVHDYEEANFENTVQNSFRFLENDKDLVIIESFNDTVWPWETLDEVDEIVAVRPGQMLTFDPERYQKAIQVIDNSRKRVREITFTRINDYLKPKNKFRLYPNVGLKNDEITTFINDILRKE